MNFDVDSRMTLNKLAFGPSAGDFHDIKKTGLETWLTQQLTPPVGDDCAERISAVRLKLKYTSKNPDAEVDDERPLAVLAQPIEEQWKTVAKEVPNQERAFLRTGVAAATLVRAVHSRWQLREVLADFWHNHFNVNAVGDLLVSVALPSYDRDVIRHHALGNFRELLEAVATSAAMQIYLNNRTSRGGAANENYARELFELHTLGRPAYLNALYNKWREVPGAKDGRPQGYIDQDRSEERRVGKECRSRCDWSSDVCSSDLAAHAGPAGLSQRALQQVARSDRRQGRSPAGLYRPGQIGRASCRERV